MLKYEPGIVFEDDSLEQEEEEDDGDCDDCGAEYYSK